MAFFDLQAGLKRAIWPGESLAHDLQGYFLALIPPTACGDIPNIGDYVNMIAMYGRRPAFEGKLTGGAQSCHANIVADSSEDVPDLIKE